MLKPDPASLAWDKMDGLLPAIVQDADDGRVLMQAWMDRAALDRTLESGLASFFSRSRQTAWTKGETSGNAMDVVAVAADCDGDCLLLQVRPRGPACHRGDDTCFDGAGAVRPGLAFLADLDRLIARRKEAAPDGSYTARLLESGPQRIAQKVGEEGVEVALAGAGGDSRELLDEAGDLTYHLLVMLRSRDLSLTDLVHTLRERHRAAD